MSHNLQIDHVEISRFSETIFLVIGDLILDNYLSGSASRISPEAPIPIFRQESSEYRLGGAANLAANLSALGGKVSLLGLRAEDAVDFELARLCEERGIDLLPVTPVAGFSTILKTRVMAHGQQLIRIDQEHIVTEDEHYVSEVLAHLSELIASSPELVVLLSDYEKGALPVSLIRSIISVCAQNKVKVLVDPKKKDVSAYSGSYLMKPNLAEALNATGFDSHDFELLAQEFHKKLKLDFLVLSLSEKGLLLSPANGSPTLMETVAVEVADVSGAGDSLLAGIAIGIASGLDIERATMVGNLVAGIACSHVGTHVVSIEEFLRTLRLGGKVSSVLAFPQDIKFLNPLISFEKSLGKKIVFTNGVFDLVHAGHLKLIKEAAELGDFLVVGINSDASVRRLKGESRPLQGQSHRAELVASLDFVDLAVIFDDNTPEELIINISPDVLVKGSDYKISQIAGASHVIDAGGEVVLVDLIQGMSSSKLSIGESFVNN